MHTQKQSPLRERPGSMVVWIAYFPSAAALEDFAEPHYDEDGNGSCQLWDELSNSYINHDLQEVHFFEERPIPWETQLKKHSYGMSYGQEVSRASLAEGNAKANSLLILFDQFWEGGKAPGRSLHFIGNYAYSKD